MRSSLITLAACLSLALPGTSPSAVAEPVVEGDSARRLDRYLERATIYGFSGVVAASRDNKVILRKGYGLARRAEEVAFTDDTAFDIGSTAKQFTATAILLLQSRGKLNVGDPVAHYLKGVPEDKQSITLHQLLTHTSGLTRDVPRQLDSRDAVTQAVFAKPLRAQPGEQFNYSNAGYKILAAVIEVASGEPFDTFVRRELFEKAGLVDTGFYEDTAWQDRPLALSYYETAEYADLTTFRRTWGTFGNGHIVSTAADMLTWERKLRAGDILEPATLDLLFTPAVVVDEDTSYGYGWYIGADPQRNRTVYHGGDYSGFSIDLRRIETHDTVVLIATNQGYVDGLGLKRAFLPQLQKILTYAAVPMPPQAERATTTELEALLGTYVLESGDRFIVRQQRGVLVVEPRGQQAFSLLHHARHRTLPDYDAFNEVARLVMEATTLKRIPADQTETLAPFEFAITEGWESLTELFGAVRGMEVLGTAPYPFSRTWIRTFTELHCEKASVMLTYGYQGDTFFDFTTWEDAPPPSAVIAARIGSDLFRTWSLWKKTGVVLAFGLSDEGRHQLTVTAPSGRWVAQRLPKPDVPPVR